MVSVSSGITAHSTPSFELSRAWMRGCVDGQWVHRRRLLVRLSSLHRLALYMFPWLTQLRLPYKLWHIVASKVRKYNIVACVYTSDGMSCHPTERDLFSLREIRRKFRLRTAFAIPMYDTRRLYFAQKTRACSCELLRFRLCRGTPFLSWKLISDISSSPCQCGAATMIPQVHVQAFSDQSY